MLENDTIAAIATPSGEGGLGIVRLSGPGTFDVLPKIFVPATPVSWPSVAGHTLHHGRIVRRTDDGPPSPFDDVVVGVFRAPRSYTGEDVAEITCHGGTLIIQSVLDLCLKSGARLAEPGEFTKRSFLNGKLDLVQAEAVADLIAARSESFRKTAFDQLQGRLSKTLQELRRELLDILAHLEANLDFVEDDIPALEKEPARIRICALEERANALLESYREGKILREGIRVTLTGRPNVGKSSLFNALLQEDRAIVSDVPGTTRDRLEESLIVQGVSVVLHDTAGLRSMTDGSSSGVETEGIRRARQSLERADVVLFVIDSSSEWTREDSDILEMIRGKNTVWVLNKSDRPPRFKPDDIIALAGKGVPSIPASAVTGDGVPVLKQAILKSLPALSQGLRSMEKETPPSITNRRHAGLIETARDSLRSAAAAIGRGEADECVASDLRKALEALSELAGDQVVEDVLKTIFSRFCVGK